MSNARFKRHNTFAGAPALMPAREFVSIRSSKFSILAGALFFCIFVLSSLAQAADIAVLQNGFEIRHERREISGANTRLYLDDGRDSSYVDIATDQITTFRPDEAPPVTAKPAAASAAKPPSASPADLQQLVRESGARNRVDADLIASVIRAESNFNSRALSPKGAQGLMQLMPGTASRLGVADPYRAGENIDGGTRYLRQLLLLYHDDVVKALAAYNAGPERVAQYHGVPPYRETHAYVARVVNDFNRKKLAQNKQRKASAKTGNLTSGISR